jgi:hypothetical protein
MRVRHLYAVAVVALLTACGTSTLSRPTDHRSTSPSGGSTSPPVSIAIATPAAHRVKKIPATIVARAYAQSSALLSAMYTDTTSLTGSSALITELAGPVARALTASARTSAAGHPIFPPGAVRLGQFTVQRSIFSARQVRCDFALCAGSGFTGERSAGLVVHWSGAVRYPVTIRATGHAGAVGRRYEVDLYWIVRFIPANPAFLAKQPSGPSTVTAGYLPVLSACIAKGLVVPPDPPPALRPKDFGPPTRPTSAGAPGRCPA